MRKILAAAVVTLLPTGAFAACTAGDLPGTYQLYAHTSGAETDFTTCTIKVLNSGFFKKGTPCADMTEGEAIADDVSIAKGRFTVTSQCRVRGFVSVKDDEGTERVDVLQATMSQDKGLIVGIVTGSDLSYTRFTAVKR